jgi:dTDP-4-amino-4,6-dideoxygalactose transaminase
MREFLREYGVGTEVYYPLPLHLQESYMDLGYKKGDFPCAEKASQDVLSLPVYPELSEGQKEYIIRGIIDFYDKVSR